jgi:hypothetical protein
MQLVHNLLQYKPLLPVLLWKAMPPSVVLCMSTHERIAYESTCFRSALGLAASCVCPFTSTAAVLQAIEAMEVSCLEAAQSSAAAAPGSPAAAAGEAEQEVPSDLLCPITYQLLEDPVILVDSHQTYGEPYNKSSTLLITL